MHAPYPGRISGNSIAPGGIGALGMIGCPHSASLLGSWISIQGLRRPRLDAEAYDKRARILGVGVRHANCMDHAGDEEGGKA